MLKFLLLFFLIPFYSYSGCEDGDCNNGYGTYIWFNGDTDTRGWVEGDKYVGMFFNGKMHGQGILYFKNKLGKGPNKNATNIRRFITIYKK